ncbi:MAG: hypothetical protein GOVbin4162_22 [Prokaryotic dsDNA virus sp.]|nr:MAG: hypothetical protein GOVbin4162_22 [Prokaryotic dsDNA virus sp.]|tara:strand:+ start:2530 stop:2991 length:462 start_codon:yes stop_codon:yes gene_type:complete
MLDIDLSNPTNKVRAIIGDWDTQYITDANIDYLLQENNNDILLAADEALSLILSNVAMYSREEVGDVRIYWNEVYNQLKDRKDSLKKDVLYSKSKNLFTFGGTTKSEVRRVNRSPESTKVSLTNHEFEGLLKRMRCLPTDEPYKLCWGDGYVY